MARLSVHLVAWNGAKYIPYLFESLRKQTYKDWELLAIDNNSQKDNTADLIEQELKNFTIPARLIRNKENNGFAGGHNQGVQMSLRSTGRPSASQWGPEYIQLLNQDIYLAPDYFARVVAMMDAHPEAGAGQGLLLRWHNPTQPPLNLRGGEEGLSDVVDTMGLKVMRNRRVVDFRTGEDAEGLSFSIIKDSPLAVAVFGVSGALPIYRRKAIEDIAFEGNMFDDEFGSYKEDVDLAFRLRSAGWKAYVATSACAWHDRTAAGPQEITDRAALHNRKGRPNYVNYYSYRNHLVVLLKNEHRANFAKDWPWILWYEFKKCVYLFFTDWGTLKGLQDINRRWPAIKAKRAYVMKHYKIRPGEMRKWYV